MRELSVTDVECQWKKTSTPKVTLPVSELYPQVEDTYNPLARDISMEDVAWFRSALQDPAWGQNLVVLEEFYQQHILPVLISRED
ncbi:unnamed protein product [Gadus morhua 'NCC']